MVPAPQESSAAPASVPGSLRNLLSGLVDYAGMFPPAELTLEAALRNFLRYAQGPHAWILGKFVVPAAQLGELRQFLESVPQAQPVRCGLSVLLGTEPLRDAEMIQAALSHTPGGVQGARFFIEAVEFRPGSPAIVSEMSAAFRPEVPVFCEVPLTEDAGVWLTAIRQAGRFAKMRTGGLTVESFPSSAMIAKFMAQCKNQEVAFKATAGLHHPVRSQHPLTSEKNSVCGVMHGFLNAFLGAALLEKGISYGQLVEILDDTRAAGFRFTERFAYWSNLFVNNEEIARARRRLAVSFGSCSFEEPIQDLQELGLL